ncbi:MAG: PEFG-CTERM sorting domain-containing protein [Nitrososphaera sp.]
MVISSLEFRYPQNASSIDVIGTSVIPEFGSFSIIVTAVGMASILILSSRKKSCGRNRI